MLLHYFYYYTLVVKRIFNIAETTRLLGVIVHGYVDISYRPIACE